MNSISILQYMTFPNNFIFAVIWIAVLIYMFKNARNSFLIKFLLSSHATIGSIIAIIIGTLGIAFIPNFSTSTVFILILFFVLSNLFLVILSRFRDKNGIRLRFIMNHAGLWLALFAGYIGAADTIEVSVRVFRNAPTNEAFNKNGESIFLDYKLMLNNLEIENSADGTPIDYEATIIIDRDTATLRVNHPYARTPIENIYLTDHAADASFCTVNIVRSPWKYPMFIGILMMLFGAVLLFIQGPKRENI